VEYSRHKIGEVIVRKEIEIRMIEVPVRREKLIIEQISPDYRQLAEIDLGQGEIDGLELKGYQSSSSHSGNHLVVSGEFDSPKTGAWLLDSIAHQSNHSCKKIRIEIEVEDSSQLDLYQSWFDRCSIRAEHQD
ncbi:MAG: YsnF/AvaK domain-containing protein, partial [Phormidesmis sp. CAN_BIN36]|nr:YsnF/AvaK domain-containing protein [Phormidesmis sp. CAN_BIN36]